MNFSYRLLVGAKCCPQLQVSVAGELSMAGLWMSFSIVLRLKSFVSSVLMGVRIKEMVDKLIIKIDRK